MVTTTKMKNVNFMSEEKYNSLTEVKDDEIYAVDFDTSKLLTTDTNQTITGLKTFEREEQNLVFKDSRIDINATSSVNLNDYIDFKDKNNFNVARFSSIRDTNNFNIAMMQCWNENNNKETNIRLGINPQGNIYTYSPPSANIGGILTTLGINLSRNGYVRFGNGLIVQWGISGGGIATFPTPFSSRDTYSVVFNTSVTFDTYNTHINITDVNYGSGAKPGFVYLIAIGY